MLTTLDNGLRVVLQENRTAPVVALQVWVDVGAADDPDELAGLAHVLEHMAFKGTARRGVGDIAKEIEGAGGDINAWTSFDQTVYHVVMASRFFDKGLDVLADSMQNTQVDDAELEREIKVVLEEIKEGDDVPAKVVSRDLFRLAFKRHPYGRPVIGYEQTVKAMAPAKLRELFRQRYRPQNMTLVVVGDVDRQQALRRIRQAFNAGGAPATPPPRKAEPTQRQMRVKVRRQPTKEAHVAIAIPIPAVTHSDTPAIDLASIILGQGDSSRLVRRVRRELRLATDVYAYAYTPKDPGLLLVGATTPPDKVVPAVEAISRELFRMAQEEVTSEELQRAQTIVESDAVYQKETVQGQARKLGFYQTVAGDVSFEAEYNRRVAALDRATIREAFARYIVPERMSIAVVSPQADRKLAATVRRTVVAARTARAGKRVRVAADGGLTKVTLPNGARLVFQRDHSVPLVAIRAVWNGGLRYETAANNGVNNMLAALITRGTTSRGAHEIHAEVEGMAGAISGFSGRNSFGIRAELLAKHWERGLEILADCVLHPAFEPSEIEAQRQELLDEIQAREDNVSAVAMQLFSRTLYRKHPYRLDMLGAESSVRAFDRRKLVRYYTQHFSKDQMVIAVVGDVDRDQLVAKFTQLFGGKPRAKAGPPPHLPQEPPRRAPAVALRKLKKEQAHVVLGYPGVTLRSKDRFALELMASLLAGQGGRLFVELRDRQGLAYRVNAFAVEGIELGYFAAYMATSAENIEAAVAGFEHEFERLRQRPVPAAELARVKRYLIGSHDISLQRRPTVAAHIAFNEVYGLGYRAHLKYAQQIDAVTAADVQRAARRYLDNSKRVIAIVHPNEMSPALIEKLGGKVDAGVVPATPSPAKGKAPSKGKATSKGKAASKARAATKARGKATAKAKAATKR